MVSSCEATGLDAGGQRGGRQEAWAGGRAWLSAWPVVLLCPVWIIDPFVSGGHRAPVDCNKEQTRVVDDNGEHVGGWGVQEGCGHPEASLPLGPITAPVLVMLNTTR